MASARQVSAASKLVGEQVHELVPLAMRKPAFPWLLAAAAVVAFVIVSFVPFTGAGSGTLTGALIGGSVGAAFAFGASPRALVLSPRGLTLLGSSQLMPTPNKVLGSVSPDAVQIGGGFINRVVTIGGDKHVVSRAFVSRLEKMLAAARS